MMDYCAVEARLAGEQLFGTAARVDFWLMVEYRGQWGAKSFWESDLPQAVKAHLQSATERIPNTRIQLIRQFGTEKRETITFYVAVSREVQPVLYEFQMSRYEDILEIDLDQLRSGLRTSSVRSEPLLMVCTHGQVDRCCQIFGEPIYRGLAKAAKGLVWQTDHIGGHRFAATLVALPHGVYYGHVDEEDIPGLVREHLSGHIYMRKYRGRSCYAGPAQAADFFLRQQTGKRWLNQFYLLETQEVSAQSWAVQFTSLTDADEHRLHILRHTQDYVVHTSTKAVGSAERRKPQYYLVRYIAIAPG